MGVGFDPAGSETISPSVACECDNINSGEELERRSGARSPESVTTVSGGEDIPTELKFFSVDYIHRGLIFPATAIGD